MERRKRGTVTAAALRMKTYSLDRQKQAPIPIHLIRTTTAKLFIQWISIRNAKVKVIILMMGMAREGADQGNEFSSATNESTKSH